MSQEKHDKKTYPDVPQEVRDRKNARKRQKRLENTSKDLEPSSKLTAQKREQRNTKQRTAYKQRKEQDSQLMDVSIDQEILASTPTNDSLETSNAAEQQTHHRIFQHLQSAPLLSHIGQPVRIGNDECLLYDVSIGHMARIPKCAPVLKRHLIPTAPYVLPAITSCIHCSAKKFPHETENFCCSKGSTILYSTAISDELAELYLGTTPTSIHFRQYIRAYNNAFAFTSFRAKLDPQYTKRVNGIYTFRAQGQIYHYISTLYPPNKKPSFLQLYFYDTESEVSNRKEFGTELDDKVIKQVIHILRDNPYAKFFRSLRENTHLDTCQIKLKANPKIDAGRTGAPLVSQVGAIWYEDREADDIIEREIIVHKHTGEKQSIRYYYGCYDPLQYPLLFPQGEPGWHQGIKKRKPNNHATSTSQQQDTMAPQVFTAEETITHEASTYNEDADQSSMVSVRDFYAYQLQIRPSINEILLRCGRLLQQYTVDMYVKIETSRLDYFRNNQDQIRADLYQGIVDSIKQGETEGSNVGRRIVLPGSFTGGPRDMRRRFLNAITLVEKYGKPDIFLTMTCNPNWPEIQNELMSFEEAQNRPDLLTRVFRSKFEELRKDIVKDQFFGPVAAYTYVVEFQKRGLPHIHMLLILKSSHKLHTPDQFDAFISAELPNANVEPHLFKMVTNHMMHGPCGILNMNKQCMENGSCKNHYPKDFCSKTSVSEDGYPRYRRQDTKDKTYIRGHMLDNRWVVPYNAFLLAKYNCHINVEVCSTIKAVKYLYKYIYKGHDQVIYRLEAAEKDEEIDEIQEFQKGRWISPPEAVWRIYRFPLYDMNPSVITLQLHLEGCQPVRFKDNTNLQSIINDTNQSKTMLTEFFSMNTNDDNAKAANMLYRNFPERFVWNTRTKRWTFRKRGQVIGRIITKNPNQGEEYYLRLLLNYIPAPKSYMHLRTVNGEIYNSYREAAMAHGLLEGDTIHKECMQQACLYQMPRSLRQTFCILLVHGSPSNPKDLFLQFEEEMIEDYTKIQGYTKPQARHQLLETIESKLQSMGKSLLEFQLNHFVTTGSQNNHICREIQDELNIAISQADLAAVHLLNTEQRAAYDQILTAMSTNQGKSFFIDGPGGTGKSYLYRAILATVRSQGKIALATASSGVAASILPNGRTAHSRFKIPIDTEGKITCNVKNQTGTGKLLIAASIIIWDEASMAKKQTIEALDYTLKDLMKSKLPFGGKVVVLGGDFRQVLPVVPKGSKEDSMNASLIRSHVWTTLTKLQLTQNMRAKDDLSFSKYILEIGNGMEPQNIKGQIKIPQNFLTHRGKTISNTDDLLRFVFPQSTIYADNSFLLSQSAILTPKNEAVDEINHAMISQFPGEEHTYLSFNQTNNKTQQGMYEDFLNSISAPGIAAHQLVLKVGCPILLLRNLDPSNGLCNGTRLICKHFQKHLICAEIAVGDQQGSTVLIPRIPMKPNNTHQYPVQFTRRQFPVRLCFAMTINKAQGQTLDTVGVYLPNPVFSHGQLYVALSRATTASRLKILIHPTDNDPLSTSHTDNIVYKELLIEAATTLSLHETS